MTGLDLVVSSGFNEWSSGIRFFFFGVPLLFIVSSPSDSATVMPCRQHRWLQRQRFSSFTETHVVLLRQLSPNGYLTDIRPLLRLIYALDVYLHVTDSILPLYLMTRVSSGVSGGCIFLITFYFTRFLGCI